MNRSDGVASMQPDYAHRFVWNPRRPRPKVVEYGYSIAAVWGEDTPLTPEGALALPGDYDVALIVDGQESHQTLTVAPDPRVHATRAELEQAFAFYREVQGELAKAWQTYGEIDAVHEQLEALQKNEAAAKAKGAVEAFENKISPFREGKGKGAPNIGTIAEVLASLATDVEGADAGPTDAQKKVFADAREGLARVADLWKSIRDHEMPALNRTLTSAGIVEVHIPSSAELHIRDVAEGKDLP